MGTGDSVGVVVTQPGHKTWIDLGRVVPVPASGVKLTVPLQAFAT